MNILFCIKVFNNFGGGVECVLVDVVNFFYDCGYSVLILIFEKLGG